MCVHKNSSLPFNCMGKEWHGKERKFRCGMNLNREKRESGERERANRKNPFSCSPLSFFSVSNRDSAIQHLSPPLPLSSTAVQQSLDMVASYNGVNDTNKKLWNSSSAVTLIQFKLFKLFSDCVTSPSFEKCVQIVSSRILFKNVVIVI